MRSPCARPFPAIVVRPRVPTYPERGEGQGVQTGEGIRVDGWQLREATEADAGTLAALVREAFEEYRGRLDPPSGAHAETPQAVRDRLHSARAVLALAD